MKTLSIVTCSMNRTEHLIRCVQAASECSIHIEHIIIDWSSHEPVRADQLPTDNRIRLLRVEGEKYWVSSRAYNFGWSFSTGSHVLKLDADQLVTEDFFYTNDWVQDVLLASDPNVGDNFIKTATGTFFVPLAYLRLVGGCNEYLDEKGWGYEDLDLFARLRGVCSQQPLDVGGLSSIEHSDLERVKYSDTNNLIPTDIQKSCLHSRNHWLARTLIWNTSIKVSTYREEDGRWRADYVPRLPDYFAKKEAVVARKLAIDEVLGIRLDPLNQSNIFAVYHLIMQQSLVRLFRAISLVPRLYARIINIMLRVVIH
ncbi:MAG: glycosyltransferase family 2 protein [Candidatus Electrothrix sp. AW5]|nr:glycosyltransferase family 2 protein [Candidatus Electrothrix gigas]